MRLKLITLLLAVILIITATACSGNHENTIGNSGDREVIINNDNTNEERNRLLAEDIKFFKKQLPKKHTNLFTNITKQEFNDRTDQLISKVDLLNNTQVFTELSKIIASVGDAHTNINIWDGYSYPLKFWIFDGKVYIVDADTGLEELIYSQVLKIGNVDIDLVIEQLTSLISHENESWVLAMLPNYLQSPVYLYGLGIIESETEAIFTAEKDGKVQDFTVSALEFGETANYINNKLEDVLIGKYDKYYDYEYLPDQKAIYFAYNNCTDLDDNSFADFNTEMFDFIEDNEVDKIVIDLRNNTGGNSEILNPFTKRLKSYIAVNDKVKVYVLVGRNTMSSGMFAIYRIKESVPEAITIGEPTGGALDFYGEVRTFKLPSSQIPISYSTKYFEFSKQFSYKNDGIGTFLPEITLQPTMEDYKSGSDVVLNYALSD